MRTGGSSIGKKRSAGTDDPFAVSYDRLYTSPERERALHPILKIAAIAERSRANFEGSCSAAGAAERP